MRHCPKAGRSILTAATNPITITRRAVRRAALQPRLWVEKCGVQPDSALRWTGETTRDHPLDEHYR